MPVVNAEVVIEHSSELDILRRAQCVECGHRGLTEKSVGRGLDTVVKCPRCNTQYEQKE